MKIKKIIIVGLIGFLCVLSGYNLLNIFLKVLIDYGWYGLVNLVIFITSLVWSINYWYSYKQEVEIIKRVADEITAEKIKSDPDFFSHSSPNQFRHKIENHLFKKHENEHYVFFAKKKRDINI